jgi:hypothetical protein
MIGLAVMFDEVGFVCTWIDSAADIVGSFVSTVDSSRCGTLAADSIVVNFVAAAGTRNYSAVDIAFFGRDFDCILMVVRMMA